MKKLIFTLLYLLIINSVLLSQEREFEQNIITYNETNVSGLFIADVNNDNFSDIISTSFDNEVVWWENEDTASNWIKHVIDDEYNGALYVYASDINNDSFIDVIVSGANTDIKSIVWYKNNGTDFETWERIVVSDSLANGHGIYTGDIDLDGDMDIAATSVGDNQISWYENVNSNGDGLLWIDHVVTDSLRESQTLCLGDINNDGYLDIIGGSSKDDSIVCFINGGGDPIQWTEILIDDEIDWPHWVDTIDMDHDGDLDFYASGYASHEISWYENDLENNEWIKHKVITGFTYTLASTAGDMDNDGDNDFIGTTAGASQVVYWENQGDNLSFTRLTIGTGYIGAWPVRVGDLNNDEYLDIVVGAQGSGRLAWFKNDTVTPPPVIDDIEEFGFNQSLKIYPNPVQDNLNIEFDLKEKTSIDIELFNIEGIKVKVLEQNYNCSRKFIKEYGISELEPGIYILRISTNQDLSVNRFVIK